MRIFTHQPRRLVLMRHAKTDHNADEMKRALTKEGWMDAWSVAVQLKHDGWTPTRVLISQTLRAQQTWEAMRSYLAPSLEAVVDQELYPAVLPKLEQTLKENKTDVLLMLGHSPALSRLVYKYAQVPVHMGAGWAFCFVDSFGGWKPIGLIKPKSDWPDDSFAGEE